MEIKKKRKFLLFGLAALFGLILTLFGGGKLVLYILLLITGIVIGYHIKAVITVVRDYRLSLKMNTVLFNAKESEKMKETIKQLQAELQAAETRMNLKEQLK